MLEIVVMTNVNDVIVNVTNHLVQVMDGRVIEIIQANRKRNEAVTRTNMRGVVIEIRVIEVINRFLVVRLATIVAKTTLSLDKKTRVMGVWVSYE